MKDRPAFGSNDWSGFTEAAYAEIVDLARERYRFAEFSSPGDGRHVLWRHDVDFSVHRAVRLAEIEQSRGVTATYFFMLHSAFYNLSEAAVLSRARRIVAMGHRIGLHFEADAYPGETWTRTMLEDRIAGECNALAALLGAPVDAVSFHNPEAAGLPALDAPRLAGLVNAYGAPIMEGYHYCSDSNGYWRFGPLPDVLVSGGHERLHVLTHPGWWTAKPMPPRERIERCASGRAMATMRDYDALLEAHGRDNIG